MAASPSFTSAASGRPFVLFPPPALLLTQLRDTPKLAAITPASRLEVRPAPEMVSSGIPELDALTGGWPRGCLSEICGSVSSGRTGIVLAALAQATQRGEACALVDASDALDPASAAAARIEMGRLLWIRCGKKNSPERNSPLTTGHCPLPTDPRPRVTRRDLMAGSQLAVRSSKLDRLEQVLKITDLLLQSNGFGMIVLDLADIPALSSRRIPLASWFRFRRAVEHTPTVLLVLEQQPIAGSCSSVLMQVSGQTREVTGHRSSAVGKKPPAFSHQHSASPVTRLGAAVSRDEETLRERSMGEQETFSSRPSHTELLDRFEITVELLRSRLDRKPAQSVANFRTRAKWAG